MPSCTTTVFVHVLVLLNASTAVIVTTVFTDTNVPAAGFWVMVAALQLSEALAITAKFGIDAWQLVPS